MFNPDLKRGSLELLILSVLEDHARHGYDIGKLLALRSGGELELPVSTLYSILYRMEERGWIKGRWIEKPGERRRCHYALTDEPEAGVGSVLRHGRPGHLLQPGVTTSSAEHRTEAGT
jgi:DNA-binding PadR family transcriptional regulator